MRGIITKICLSVMLAAGVTACTYDTQLYDNDLHHNMKKHNKYMEYKYNKYDYPPYRQECPADHRAKGWC